MSEVTCKRKKVIVKSAVWQAAVTIFALSFCNLVRADTIQASGIRAGSRGTEAGKLKQKAARAVSYMEELINDSKSKDSNAAAAMVELDLVQAAQLEPASGKSGRKAEHFAAAEGESAAMVLRVAQNGPVGKDTFAWKAPEQAESAKQSSGRPSPWGQDQPALPATGSRKDKESDTKAATKVDPWQVPKLELSGKTPPEKVPVKPEITKTESARKTEPVPIYLDPLARDGRTELLAVSPAEAKTIVDSLPGLFLDEGKRELELLNKNDSSRPQVYVSQDIDAFKRKYPDLKVYPSIQDAVNKAADGSVINVLPGPSSAKHPKGRPYYEHVDLRRSNLVLKTNEKMPATINGGGFSLGSGVHDVKILNFNMEGFSGRDAAVRVEGQNISNIVVGGNYFYDAKNSEAVGFYGTSSNARDAIKNVYLMANVIGQDRQGSSRPLHLSARQLEATVFNGNVDGIVAVGNIYLGTSAVPLNLGLDFIGGEDTSSGAANQARNGFSAFNYGKHVGHPTRWAAGAGYVDGASRITQVYNMSEYSNFCGEIGSENAGKKASDNKFSANICKDSSAAWIAVGAPENNGASVSGSEIRNNIVIGGSNAQKAHLQYNTDLSASKLRAENQFFAGSSQIVRLPARIVELHRYFYAKP